MSDNGIVPTTDNAHLLNPEFSDDALKVMDKVFTVRRPNYFPEIAKIEGIKFIQSDGTIIDRQTFEK